MTKLIAYTVHFNVAAKLTHFLCKMLQFIHAQSQIMCSYIITQSIDKEPKILQHLGHINLIIAPTFPYNIKALFASTTFGQVYMGHLKKINYESI